MGNKSVVILVPSIDDAQIVGIQKILDLQAARRGKRVLENISDAVIDTFFPNCETKELLKEHIGQSVTALVYHGNPSKIEETLKNSQHKVYLTSQEDVFAETYRLFK